MGLGKKGQTMSLTWCFVRGGRIRTYDLRVMSLRFQRRDVSPFPSVELLSQAQAEFAISFH